MFFFFQAEDGIRDYKVTGVQTCALPIYLARHRLMLVSTVYAMQSRCLPFSAVNSFLTGRCSATRMTWFVMSLKASYTNISAAWSPRNASFGLNERVPSRP